MAYIQSQRDSNSHYLYDYFTGCLSYCNDSNIIIDGSCSGVGCCQVTIPSGLTDNSVTNFSGYNHDGLLSFNPCDYAFLVDKDWFQFGKSNLTMSTNTSVPVWLNWAIRENNCAQAQKNPELYECRNRNSECYDSVNGPGYLGKCLKGYQGNPYLVNGCAGISASTVPLLIVTLSMIFVCQKRRLQRERDMFFKKNGGLILYNQLVSRKVETMKIFTEEQLVKITNNFSVEIGHGGQGTVYKGLMEDNREVAVKKCMVVGDEGKKRRVHERNDYTFTNKS
ncbi:wall-associated receptor kinase 2-like isoform X1 [Carex rostrata]